MLERFLDWAFGKLKPVHVDGLLYVLIAIFGAMQLTLTSDEVYKYTNPYLVFYAKAVVGCCAAAVGALKMFRSNTYSDSKKKEQHENKTNP